MKRRILALLFLFIFSGVAFSAPDPFAILQDSMLKLILSQRSTRHISIHFEDPVEKFKGTADLFCVRRGEDSVANLHFSSNYRGAETSGEGTFKYIDRVAYFSLKKLPLVNDDILNQWFLLDTHPFLSWIQRKESQQEHMALALLNFVAGIGNLQQQRDEIRDGILMHHLVLKLDPNELMQTPVLFVEKGELPPLTKEDLKPFRDLPVFPIHFWIGVHDHQLYHVRLPLEKYGDYRADIRYQPTAVRALLTSERDAIDARALGLTFTEQLYPLVPSKDSFAKRNLSEIPGTKIYLASFHFAHTKVWEGLKPFLLKNQYHLQNVEVLQAKLDSIQTRDAAVGEIKKQFPEKKWDSPNTYLILFTNDGPQGSGQDESNTVVLGNTAIVSMPSYWSYDEYTEKLLLRALGKMYWKLPISILSEDPMYGEEPVSSKQLRKMGYDFRVDESINPLNLNARTHLATLDLRSGKPREAVELLNTALLFDPRSEEAYVLLGEAYEKSHFLYLALQEYRAAYYLSPKNETALKIAALRRMLRIH